MPDRVAWPHSLRARREPFPPLFRPCHGDATIHYRVFGEHLDILRYGSSWPGCSNSGLHIAHAVIPGIVTMTGLRSSEWGLRAHHLRVSGYPCSSLTSFSHSSQVLLTRSAASSIAESILVSFHCPGSLKGLSLMSRHKISRYLWTGCANNCWQGMNH